MTWRPIVCYTVSALMHIFVLILPLAIMALPVHPAPQENVIIAKLVGNIPYQQHKGPMDAQGSADQHVEQQDNQQEVGPEDSVSFEANGKVSVSYLDLLKARIFLMWKYPDDAIQKGQQGKVSVSFVLSSNGELVDIGILKSSGSYSLDTAAMAAIEQASPFGPLPSDVSSKPLRITGHFSYVLD
jgi:TonB family protein